MAMFIREVPCDICDTVKDVNNFCLSCKQKFCDNCKSGHLRSAVSKHHKFVPIGDSLLASSQRNDFCNEHKEENQFYCKTCSKTCCSICLSDYHNNHDLSLITKLIGELRNEIEEKLAVKEKDLADIENVLRNYASASQNCYEQSDEIVSYIKKTIHGWVTELKSFENELVEETRRAAKKDAKEVEKRTTELRTSQARYTRELQDVRLLLRTSSDASLLEQKRQIISQIESITISVSEPTVPALPKVILRQSTGEEVREILRNVHSPSIRNVSSDFESRAVISKASKMATTITKPVLRNEIKVKNRVKVTARVYDIAPVSESKAWIVTSWNLMLVNTDGQILLQQPHDNDSYSTEGTSVTSTSSENALYISSHTVINTIDQTGKVSMLVDMKPKKIHCIRASKLRNVIYVAADNDILKMSLDGIVKERISCAALALTELTDSRLVAINTQQDIVLLNKEGNMTLLSNSVKWDWKIFCTALTSDSCDRIVVGNPHGKQIHVYELRKDRLELQKRYSVYMTRNGINDLTVDRQCRLWIGTDRDGVLIGEYSE